MFDFSSLLGITSLGINLMWISLLGINLIWISLLAISLHTWELFYWGLSKLTSLELEIA